MYLIKAIGQRRPTGFYHLCTLALGFTFLFLLSSPVWAETFRVEVRTIRSISDLSDGDLSLIQTMDREPLARVRQNIEWAIRRSLQGTLFATFLYDEDDHRIGVAILKPEVPAGLDTTQFRLSLYFPVHSLRNLQLRRYFVQIFELNLYQAHLSSPGSHLQVNLGLPGIDKVQDARPGPYLGPLIGPQVATGRPRMTPEAEVQVGLIRQLLEPIGFAIQERFGRFTIFPARQMIPLSVPTPPMTSALQPRLLRQISRPLNPFPNVDLRDFNKLLPGFRWFGQRDPQYPGRPSLEVYNLQRLRFWEQFLSSYEQLTGLDWLEQFPDLNLENLTVGLRATESGGTAFLVASFRHPTSTQDLGFTIVTLSPLLEQNSPRLRAMDSVIDTLVGSSVPGPLSRTVRPRRLRPQVNFLFQGPTSEASAALASTNQRRILESRLQADLERRNFLVSSRALGEPPLLEPNYHSRAFDFPAQAGVRARRLLVFQDGSLVLSERMRSEGENFSSVFQWRALYAPSELPLVEEIAVDLEKRNQYRIDIPGLPDVYRLLRRGGNWTLDITGRCESRFLPEPTDSD